MGGHTRTIRTFLSRVDVARMRQIWLSSPDQGGNMVNFTFIGHKSVFLIVCCSPLSRTPSRPQQLITHTTHHTGTLSTQNSAHPLTLILRARFFGAGVSVRDED